VKLLKTTGVSVRLALALVVSLQVTATGLVERWNPDSVAAKASSVLTVQEARDPLEQRSAAPLSLDQLTANSDRIVVGTVDQRSSCWNDEHTGIYTSVSLSVEETLKGTAGPDPITITSLGGEAEGIVQWVSNMPNLNVADRTVVFLKRLSGAQTPNVKARGESLSPEQYEVYGASQGDFKILGEKVGTLDAEEFKNRIKKLVRGEQLPLQDIDMPPSKVTLQYSYPGQSWPHPPSPVVSYRVNENSADCTGEAAAVQNAAATWNGARAYFSFNYAGSTTAVSSVYNGVNEIMWTNLGAVTAIAVATYWYNPASNAIVECDMEFNTYYAWSTAATPPSGRYDVQTIALHELGHFLSLSDLYSAGDSAKVMYGYGSPGTTRRALHADDIAGIQYIYGALPSAPAMTNGTGASNVAQTAARLNGQVTSTGGENPTVHIYWGQNDGGTTAGNWAHDVNLGVKAAGAFYTDITGLSGGTIYYYRCYGASSGGGSWATPTSSFTTSPAAPTVTNYNGATNISPTSARLNGQVPSTGGENPTVHIYWGQNDGGTTAGNWAHDVNLGVKAAGAFYSDITALPADTLVYYRCYAINSAGGSWAGGTSSFATFPPLPPAVTTSGATLISTGSATLNGNLSSFGTASSSNVSFLWGTSPSGTNETTPISINSTGSFSAYLTGLSANTTYYFRAKAVARGTTLATNQLSFVTRSVPTIEPIVDPESRYYCLAPVIDNFGFDDSEGLDDGWYQMDSYSGTWTSLFTNVTGTAWDSDHWTVPAFAALGQGEHTIYFKASNDAGAVSGGSGEWSWRFYKDTILPSTAGGLHSSSHTIETWSNNNTVRVTWASATDNGSGIAGYSFLWDDVPGTVPDNIMDTDNVTATVSPALTDGGSHYFHIQAVDTAGNWGASVSIGPFFIDATAPLATTNLTSISHLPIAWSGDNTVAVSWDGASENMSGLSGYATLWSSSATSHPPAITNSGNVTSSISLPLSDGNSHYFHIMALDLAGNWGPCTHIGPFWIDAVGPTGPALTSSTPTPSTWSNAGTVAVNWTAAADNFSGLDGYSIVWDTSPGTNPDNIKDIPYNFSGNVSVALSDGIQHYFHIRPVDKAGNWGASVHFGPFWIETVPPSSVGNLSSTSHTAGIWSNSSIVSANWTAATDETSGIDGYSILWDTTPGTIPPSTKTTGAATSASSPTLTDGANYYAHIRAVDRAGNWGPAAHAGPFAIETVPPVGPTDVASSSHRVSTWSANSTIAVTWAAATDATSGLDGYSILWNTTAETNPPNNVNVDSPTTSNNSSVLADGNSHYFHIKAKDGAGNWSAPVHVGPFFVSVSSPVLSAGTVSPTSGYQSATYVFSANYRHPLNLAPGSIKVSVDGGASTNMTVASGQSGNYTTGQIFTYSMSGSTLAAGSHTFAFFATDNASRNAIGDVAQHAGPNIVIPAPPQSSGGFGGGVHQ
jgi:hypothetical protein